jgi:hypothetical protein
MKITQIPRGKIHHVYSGFDASLTVKDFWVWCSEQGIKTLDMSFFKSLVGSDFQNLEFNKLFSKLQQLEDENKFIKSRLPKYIMRMSMRASWKVGFTTTDDPDTLILPFLDNIFGPDKVKTAPATPAVISIEVWLNDDADLATIEFYQVSNPELFYHRL